MCVCVCVCVCVCGVYAKQKDKRQKKKKKKRTTIRRRPKRGTVNKNLETRGVLEIERFRLERFVFFFFFLKKKVLAPRACTR